MPTQPAARVRRRLLLGVALALPSLAIALGAGAATAKPTHSSSAAGKSVSVTLGYIGTQNVFTGPDGFAYTKGLLQKWLAPSGITIKSTAQFANGPLLTAALVGGSLNMGELGDTPALIARSQGAPTRIINQEQVGLQTVVISQPSITSISQIAGKSVVRQEGSYMDRYLQAILKQEKLLGKVTLVPELLAQAIPEFNSGQIPVLTLLPSDLPLVTAKYNVLSNSQDHPALTGTGVTEVTNQALSQDPGLPAAWNAAHDKAIKYALAHQSAYYRFEGKAEQTTPALAKKYDPLSGVPLQPFTNSGIAHLQGTLSFLVESKQAKNSFSLAGWQAH